MHNSENQSFFSEEVVGAGTLSYKINWLLVSEPGFSMVLDDFGKTSKSILKLRPRSNIV